MVFNELIFYYSTFLGKNQWNKIQWAFLKDTIAVESKAFHAYEFPLWDSLIRTEVSNGDLLEYQKLADKCSNFSNYWNLNYSHFIICLLWMFDSSIVNHQFYILWISTSIPRIGANFHQRYFLSYFDWICVKYTYSSSFMLINTDSCQSVDVLSFDLWVLFELRTEMKCFIFVQWMMNKRTSSQVELIQRVSNND